jgi:adenylylsulfate kinase
MSSDIHPEFHRQLGREAKEGLLGQRGLVIWLYGLSGSGKSTLAHLLERALYEEGRATVLLDGDNLRTGLNSGLGFTEEDRRENIRRVAEVAKLFVHSGIITICSFISPYRSLRSLARQVIGDDDFIEVYVHATFESCTRRDPKGLYKKAAEGKVAHFTGRDSVFEEPDESFVGLRLDTESESKEESLARLLAVVRPRLGARSDGGDSKRSEQ